MKIRITYNFWRNIKFWTKNCLSPFSTTAFTFHTYPPWVKIFKNMYFLIFSSQCWGQKELGPVSNRINDTLTYFLCQSWKSLAIYSLVGTIPNPILICAYQKHVVWEDCSSHVPVLYSYVLSLHQAAEKSLPRILNWVIRCRHSGYLQCWLTIHSCYSDFYVGSIWA